MTHINIRLFSKLVKIDDHMFIQKVETKTQREILLQPR